MGNAVQKFLLEKCETDMGCEQPTGHRDRERSSITLCLASTHFLGNYKQTQAPGYVHEDTLFCKNGLEK